MSTNFILTEEQSSKTVDQLSFDFQSIAEMNMKKNNAVKLNIPNSDPQRIKIPFLNTPDNFLKNFAEISTAFESDTVEAARYLLRTMTKPSRDLTLSNMQKAGCSDRESYHQYLMNYLQKERETPKINGIDDKKVTEIVKEFRAGDIDENTAKVRLRTEANYPEWVGSDQLLQTKSYIEWQSKLEIHNKRKYDFIETLPQQEQITAREWLSDKKYVFNGESKSIGNYLNEQMDTGTLALTDNGVNGYNVGKYGNLFAEHLINSLKMINNEREKLIEDKIYMRELERNTESVKQRAINYFNNEETIEEPTQEKENSPSHLIKFTSINLIGQEFHDTLDLNRVTELEEYDPQLKITYYKDKETGKFKGLSVTKDEYNRIKNEYEAFLTSEKSERAYNESVSILENAVKELDSYKESLQKEIKETTQEQSSDIGLNSLQQEIELQHKKRNSVLSTVSKGVLTDLEKITDIKELRNWLGSAENALRIAKEAGLKEIKRQYDDGGSVSIGDNILKRDDILDRVSPQDIKQILIYNAQHIVDSINNKINSLSYPTELIQTEQDNFELSNNEYEEIDWKRVKELEIEGKSKRNDKALVNYLERRGVPKELVKQAFLWAFSSTAAPDDFTEGLKKYIEKSGHL